MSSKKYYLYRIDWRDAHGQGGWRDLDDNDFKHYEVHSVGWLIGDDKDYYRLALSLTSEGQSGDRLTIPKKWVKKVKRITGTGPIEYK